MSSDDVISVDNVSKRFRLRSSGSRSLKSAALDVVAAGRLRRPGSEFWALRDIGFSVGAGETLGIIGANGAGKSTLLSLLAGTKVPTSGRIETRGTISSLLELGAGFHPDLTGRENVFLSGAIMGLSRKQMKGRFDAIVDFAGIEDFIDQPVKHYSSGMYVRLGFAVAVEVDPDILLIDEVLAVGDVGFRRKCMRKMDEFRRKGKTMLIISHDLPAIQLVSDRILFLESGKILGIGEPESVISSYESRSRDKASGGLARERGTGEVKITGVELKNAAGDATDRFKGGSSLTAVIDYDAASRIENPVFGFAIADAEGRLVHGSNTQIEKAAIPGIDGKGRLTLRLDNLALASGNYLFSFSVHSFDHSVNYHRLDNCCSFTVESVKRFEGCAYLPSTWGVTGDV